MKRKAVLLYLAALFALSGCQTPVPAETIITTTISQSSAEAAETTTEKPAEATTDTTTSVEAIIATTAVTNEIQSPEEYYTLLFEKSADMPKASDCTENFEQIKCEAVDYNGLSENIEALLRKNAVCCEFFVHGGKFTPVDGDDVISPDEVFICESELFPDFGSLKDFANSVYTEECTQKLMDTYKLFDYGNGEIRKIGTGPIWSVNIMSAENMYAITEADTDYCRFVCFWDSFIPMPDEEIPENYTDYAVTEHTAVRVNGQWKLTEMVKYDASEHYALRINKT